MAQLTFEAFPLQPYAHEWLTLLKANGGESAPLLYQEEGRGDGDLYMCCLLLPSPDRPPGPLRTHLIPESYDLYDEVPSRKQLKETMRSAGRWGAIYRRIVIVVPVAVKEGIAMAQGIRRLDVTSYSDESATRGLGMELLAHVAFHFRLQYLFLSPIHPFHKHVQNTLDERAVPYGKLRHGSLFKALNETTRTEEHAGIVVALVEQVYKQKMYDVIQLRIEPSGFRNRETYQLVENKYVERRALYLDPREIETSQSRRHDGAMRVHADLHSYNFLWKMAGNGIFAIDGLCLAIAILGVSWL